MVSNETAPDTDGPWVVCGAPACDSLVHDDVGFDSRIVVDIQTPTTRERTLYCSGSCVAAGVQSDGGGEGA